MPVIALGAQMSDALVEMSAKGFGCVGHRCRRQVAGIITDGDLRRHMRPDLMTAPVDKVMTASPKTIGPNNWPARRWQMLNASKITALIVVEKEAGRHRAFPRSLARRRSLANTARPWWRFCHPPGRKQAAAAAYWAHLLDVKPSLVDRSVGRSGGRRDRCGRARSPGSRRPGRAAAPGAAGRRPGLLAADGDKFLIARRARPGRHVLGHAAGPGRPSVGYDTGKRAAPAQRQTDAEQSRQR